MIDLDRSRILVNFIYILILVEERILSALQINGNASSESQSKSYIRLLHV